MPGGLNAFAKASSRHVERSEDEAVHRWTAFSYFTPWMVPEDAGALKNDLMEGYSSGGYRGLGLFRGAAHWHRRLIYCPACRAADAATLGFGAWRRCHQLPGVFVCPWHGNFLRGTDYTALGSSQLWPCPGEGTGYELAVPFHQAVAAEIARSSSWLIQNPQETYAPSVIQRSFRSMLEERNLLGSNGTAVACLDHRVREALLKDGDKGGVRSFCSRSSASMQRLWGRTDKLGVTPLSAIMLLCFLGTTPQEFFRRCKEPPPGFRARTGGGEPRIRQSTFERHRATLTAAVRSSPGMSRTELRWQSPTAYCFLLSHDRAWLERVLPARRKLTAAVDWRAADLKLCKRAKLLIERLLDVGTEKPVRMTFARIATALGKRTSLYRRNSRLPETLSVIAAAVEDEDRFMRRRVREPLRQKPVGHDLNWSAFVVRSGLRRDLSSPELLRLAAQEYYRSRAGQPSRT